MTKSNFFSFGVFGFLLFVLFSLLVHFDFFSAIDFDTTVKLQDNISRFFDTPFSFLSLIGSFEIATLILLILLLIYKKLNYIYVLFYFGLFHLLEFFGKAFVTHPGPPFLFFRYDIGFNFPTSYIKPGSSYPSGHLGRTFFISVIFFFIVSKTNKLSKNQKYLIYFLLAIFDFLMFISRIYLGEHWLSDVIGGSLLGFSFGILSLFFI